MRTLVFGFYGEGVRDYIFIQRVVERVLENLLPDIEILPFQISKRSGDSSLSERMIYIALEAFGYDFVIYHLDADGRDTRQAYAERFLSGFERVQEYEGNINRDFVAVIPVRETEAWMLVDFPAFRDTVGTRLNANELGFPAHARQVESIGDPKEVFEAAIQRARPNMRKTILPDEVYLPLASKVDLDRLALVPAYQEFKSRLIETLMRLHYLDA